MTKNLSYIFRIVAISSLFLVWTPLNAAQYLTYRDGLEEYDRGNLSAAFLTFQRLAEEGDAPSQNALGDMYFLGEGVAQDYAMAARWFLRAANQGVATAQLGLADLYLRGLGVERSDVRAHMWYSLSGLLAEDDDDKHFALEMRNRVARRLSAVKLADARRRACHWWRKYREQPSGPASGGCGLD
jgi:TPR repeat protein